MLPKQEPPHTLSRRADVAALCCSLVAMICWALLANWYALPVYAATPGFSFDRIPGHLHAPVLRATALLLVALSLSYGAGYWLIRQAPSVSRGIKLATILAIAGGCIANVLIYPVTAIDVFYYLAELKLVYGYHQNPYLVAFQPTFASDPLARFGWPLHVPLAYGPAWVLISGLPLAWTCMCDVLWSVLIYKVFSCTFLLLAGLLIALYHEDERSRWTGAYVFLANPLIVFDAVGNAHNDIVMTFFLLGAVFALQRRQSWLALPLLAVAVLIKAFAISLLPVFLTAIWLGKWSRAKVLVSVCAATAVVLVMLAPFWANGRMLAGMLHGMTFANNLKTGSLLSLAGTLLQRWHAPAAGLLVTRAILGSLFVMLSIILIWRIRRIEVVLACTLALFYTLVGSIHPWYWIPVVALLALHHDWLGYSYLWLASTLGLLIYMVSIWARFDADLSSLHRQALGTLIYNGPLLGFLGLVLWRYRRRERTFLEQSSSASPGG